MPTWKVLGLFAAWIAAAGMIAFVTSIVATEILRAVGVIETGDSGYLLSLRVVFVLVFLTLIAIPFVLRRRFGAHEPPPGA